MGLSTPHVFKYWELMWGWGMINDVIIRNSTWCHLWKKTREKDIVGIVTFDLISLLPNQSHYCLYYNGIPEFVRKRSMLTIKWLKQRNFEISLSESWFYKKLQTSAIIREISTSNLETGRKGSKSGVSRIIRESWQPCKYIAYREMHTHSSNHILIYTWS